MMKKNYWDLFDEVHKELSDYYFRWYFDRPMVITPQRDGELQRIQHLLTKCLYFYADHYKDYLDLIPYDSKVLEILEMTEKKEYKLGTFRPDYIISDKNEILVCEITSRFFGNGYFLSFFADKKGRELAEKAGVLVEDHRMEDMLAYFASLTENCRRICVLKSADRSDSIKLYVPFYRALGKEVIVLEAEEIHDNRHLLEDSFVLSALNQKDIRNLPMDMIRQLINGMHYNDFRTVFLAHDKRLFSLFFMDRFTGRFLNQEETDFLRSHVIRTAVFGHNCEMWEDARRNKDHYIVKHYCLGKSEKVFAGCMVSAEEWENLWKTGEIEQMILQPFISQRVHPNHWEGQDYTEYISGTILCVDDKYFGTGIFRSSSLPVLNKGDDRKVGTVLTEHGEKFNGNCLYL